MNKRKSVNECEWVKISAGTGIEKMKLLRKAIQILVDCASNCLIMEVYLSIFQYPQAFAFLSLSTYLASVELTLSPIVNVYASPHPSIR